MLTAQQRARFTVVLVGARNPQNIGASARALHDFGFSDLRIVNDFTAPFDAAQLDALQSASTSAVAAQTVMANARRFDTLAEAIADCTLIIATTAIGEREMIQPVLPLAKAALQILAHLATNPDANSDGNWGANPGAPPLSAVGRVASEMWAGKALPSQRQVALLFGSEKTGLTNDQLSHAMLLTTIPMYQPEGERHLSMNLGQSVAVCLYELTRTGLEGAREIPTRHEAPATAADRERLTQLLLDVLQTTGYTRRFPANATEPVIRQLVQQLGTTHREAMTWMGILKQILFHENHSVKASEPQR
jgi:tRNA C32,U32 (ribose-2'-O)-methylase TrmJ